MKKFTFFILKNVFFPKILYFSENFTKKSKKMYIFHEIKHFLGAKTTFLV